MLILGLKKYKFTTKDVKSTFLIKRFVIECCKTKTEQLPGQS